jgi:hypothetical protein
MEVGIEVALPEALRLGMLFALAFARSTKAPEVHPRSASPREISVPQGPGQLISPRKTIKAEPVHVGMRSMESTVKPVGRIGREWRLMTTAITLMMATRVSVFRSSTVITEIVFLRMRAPPGAFPEEVGIARTDSDSGRVKQHLLRAPIFFFHPLSFSRSWYQPLYLSWPARADTRAIDDDGCDTEGIKSSRALGPDWISPVLRVRAGRDKNKYYQPPK